MKLRQPSSHFLVVVLSFITTVSSQGTVTLNLATSNDETSTTVSVPFDTLFDASSTQQGVSIQVSSGNNVRVAQDDIACQCFSDQAGSKPLGDTFNNVFPGTKLSSNPVKIGSILCSDTAGLKKHTSSSGSENQAQQQAPPVTATQPPPSTASGPQPSTVATSPTATSTASLNNNAQPPSSSTTNSNAPTAYIKFALSSDPSDDSSTQMSVPIDSSIVETGNKQAASVTVVTISGMQQSASSSLVCQAFSDKSAKEPLAEGFGLEEDRSLGGTGVSVAAVGCAMLGGGQFGGRVGLVGS